MSNLGELNECTSIEVAKAVMNSGCWQGTQGIDVQEKLLHKGCEDVW